MGDLLCTPRLTQTRLPEHGETAAAGPGPVQVATPEILPADAQPGFRVGKEAGVVERLAKSDRGEFRHGRRCVLSVSALVALLESVHLYNHPGRGGDSADSADRAEGRALLGT